MTKMNLGYGGFQMEENEKLHKIRVKIEKAKQEKQQFINRIFHVSLLCTIVFKLVPG